MGIYRPETCSWGCWWDLQLRWGFLRILMGSTCQIRVPEDTDGICSSDEGFWGCWCRLKPALCSSCFFLFFLWRANLGPIISVSLSNIPTQRPKCHKELSSRPAPLQTQEIATSVKHGHMATDDNALNPWCHHLIIHRGCIIRKYMRNTLLDADFKCGVCWEKLATVRV